jgi:hypothetical protein
VKTPEGDRLQDAVDMWHDDSWHCPGGKLHASTEQIEHVLKLLRQWYHDEFFPRKLPSVPKEYRKPRQRTAVKEPEDSQHRGRRLVGKRSDGECEIQVYAVCTGRATDWCHRRARSQGGTWSPQNGLHGCHECHMWAHAHPSKARAMGWICKSYDPIDTGVLRRGVWVVLDEEGGFELCPRRVA